MTSASSKSARSLFIDSKLRLADRVQVNINNIASLTRQIQRGSKANDMLMQAAKNFAQQEQGLENAENNLKKLNTIATHYEYQYNAIELCSSKLPEVKQKMESIRNYSSNKDDS